LAIGVDGAGLANAEAEATWIAHHLNGDTLLGAEATPAAVSRALANYNVIHFSCHGLFRQRTPMESALLLAGGELRAGDLLEKIRRDKLRLNAEIVTLSACDTGLNKLTPGDELLGFTRAFLGAGARSLLVALWPVHELPTRLLMEYFYTAWSGGASKAAALAAAQRFVAELDQAAVAAHLVGYGVDAQEIAALLALFEKMLPGPRPFAHPTYWGAFVLVGDGG
jgi:CHAT domain-containing protein